MLHWAVFKHEIYQNCPTGLATMNPHRYRVVDIQERAERVANFQKNTTESVARCWRQLA